MLIHNILRTLGVAALLLGISLAASARHSIPAEQIDAQKVYYGVAESFETPAEVSFEDVVRATDEYDEIRRNNVERGTGKYWILMSQASERAIRAISAIGRESEYDLITARGYIASVDENIEVEDITEKVVESMEDSGG